MLVIYFSYYCVHQIGMSNWDNIIQFCELSEWVHNFVSLWFIVGVNGVQVEEIYDLQKPIEG